MDNYTIKVSNLSKSFGKVKAVNDISFNIEYGERFAFLGVNGAGKSTTISMICGICQQDHGEIIINGIDSRKDIAQTKREIGVVFQNSVLDKCLTVKDNLRSRAAMYGISGHAFTEALTRINKFLDLDEILDRPVGKLSGGQKRRADIARAIIHQPKILILDEPTTGLDPATRKMVWDTIDRMQKHDKLTVFLTTHYMEEASTADHITIIDHGHIIASGTPLELKNKYTSDALFIYHVKSDEIKQLGYDYKKVPEGYRINLPDLQTAVDLINKHPDIIKDFEIIKGQMDDVFLNATKEVK